MLGQGPEGAVGLFFSPPLLSLRAILALPRSQAQQAGRVAAATIGAAFVLSLWVLDSALQADGVRLDFASHEWLRGGALQVDVGLNVDGLTAIMLVVVTSASFLVPVS